MRIACVVGLFVSVIAAWIYVPGSTAFRIRHFEINGASAVGDLEIREQVDPLLRGKTVFTVDDAALVRRIETLPFVRSARLERHLPGGLQLTIREYRPLALGYGDGRFWLVARDGRILARARREEWIGRVPTVTLRGKNLAPGDRVADEPALRLLASRTADSTLAFEFVKTTRFAVTGRLVDGVEVRFGRPDSLRQKVLVAEKVVRDAQRDGVQLLYIDVSVPSRPARCMRTSTACMTPRGGSPQAVAAAATADTATPEENGGDEAGIDARAGTETAGANP